MRRIRRHLSFANVASAIALFVALGGGTAAALGGANTVQSDDLGPGAQVKTADLVDGSVTLGKLGANSVNSGKVQDGSLSAADANPASLQRRVTGTCPSGKAAMAVTQAGGLSCAETSAGTAGVGALFGDGFDGDVTIASDTTLGRDTYYHDLTINPGTTLNPGGFRIFVSGTLTLGDGAKIARNGLTPFGGNGLAPGTLGGSGAGGEPQVNSFGESVTNSLGGDGGDGSFGLPADLNYGLATPPTATAGGAEVFRQAQGAISGRTLTGALVKGGAGGGGGCGVGGSGGGVVVVVARSVAANGSTAIAANGGDTPGCSGGGGGGAVVVISANPKPAGLTLSAEGGSGFAPGKPGFTAWLD